MARAAESRVERVSLRAGDLVATPGRSAGLAFAGPLVVPVVRRQPLSSGRVVFGWCGIEGVLVGDGAEQGPGPGRVPSRR